ncbi:phytanoyl-CoA dioxygenase family protein [Legionella drozanskii]|uniref:Phytanoyl-CoA dioxygenase n=1 Tax=Legionella drozanskii LLAP-1 TaxID=1212489 RepID=A0A0W0SWI3_9GAMM|nr:phytanoyl-CoA dioxygenase family protein [Legionella drozanskii]KTC87727.1 phytanoyl-CoA dioxygenase [Legionella drozanskii LLAP-1]
MELSAFELDFFLTNGYLVINEFFSPSVCETLMSRIDFIIKNHQQDIPITIFSTKSNEHAQNAYFLNSGDKIHFFFEPNAFDDQGKMTRPLEKSLNKIGHALHELDPIFRQYSRDARIKIICQQLGFQKPSLLQSMYIFKQPNIGAEVNCHQDSTYLHAQNDEVLGFWFALEDATVDNGCLQVIPSPNSTPLEKRMIREADRIFFEEYQQLNWQEEQCIPLEVKQGSMIVLHGRLPHKSNANCSNHSRHAYTLHAVDAVYPYPTTNWLRWPNGLPEW